VGGTIDTISAIRAHETLAGVATSFAIGAVKGAAFYFVGGGLLKVLTTAGEAAASLEAVQAASEFFGNVVSKAGPLIEGLQLPRFFSLSTEAGEVFVKPALKRCTVPTRIVWGTGDEIFSQSSPDYLDRTLANSRGVRRVPGAKLFFPEEMPELIAEEAMQLWAV
jgi:pimeloyl-ACP methyl ester carboxylesterase